MRGTPRSVPPANASSCAVRSRDAPPGSFQTGARLCSRSGPRCTVAGPQSSVWRHHCSPPTVAKSPYELQLGQPIVQASDWLNVLKVLIHRQVTFLLRRGPRAQVTLWSSPSTLVYSDCRLASTGETWTRCRLECSSIGFDGNLPSLNLIAISCELFRRCHQCVGTQASAKSAYGTIHESNLRQGLH